MSEEIIGKKLISNENEPDELDEVDLEGEASDFNELLKIELPKLLDLAKAGKWKHATEIMDKLEEYLELKDESIFKKKIDVWNYQKRKIKELEDLMQAAEDDNIRGADKIKDRWEKLDKAFNL